MLVKEVMKKVKVIDKDISLEKASKVMRSEDISSLIIVKKDKIIGIITHEDLIENFGKRKKVYEVMTKKVITVSSDDKVDTAVEIMKKNKIRFLPVIDKHGRLAGIISDKELLGKSESEDFLFE